MYTKLFKFRRMVYGQIGVFRITDNRLAGFQNAGPPAAFPLTQLHVVARWHATVNMFRSV